MPGGGERRQGVGRCGAAASIQPQPASPPAARQQVRQAERTSPVVDPCVQQQAPAGRRVCRRSAAGPQPARRRRHVVWLWGEVGRRLEADARAQQQARQRHGPQQLAERGAGGARHGCALLGNKVLDDDLLRQVGVRVGEGGHWAWLHARLAGHRGINDDAGTCTGSTHPPAPARACTHLDVAVRCVQAAQGQQRLHSVHPALADACREAALAWCGRRRRGAGQAIPAGAVHASQSPASKGWSVCGSSQQRPPAARQRCAAARSLCASHR